MENASVAIGIVLLLVFIGPILYLIFRQSAKEKLHVSSLKKISTDHQMQLDDMEINNLFLLGIDNNAKKLIIVEPQKNMEFKVIDLNNINESYISKKTIPVPGATKNRTAVTHISLELIKNNPKQRVSEITFYDEDDNASLSAESQLFLANKWNDLIQRNLSA